MCEEESTRGVMWISVSFGIFVMDAMIACPVVDGALVGDRVAEHEEEAEGVGCGVGSVGPESMYADCYSKATYRP